ncbi:hypothetical protein SAMN05421770_10335 [Granulicella rosea]|uniref:Uncharacterized protein n=1 Tax=Granulicella rosea TaxID=474952 RepID=A0A239ID13_9BACT|nr:hypothetical protein [Granulicella rosea]SNS90933.1 hypothetical protein SAMN05421770_10335 [Granulicella rosea]
MTEPNQNPNPAAAAPTQLSPRRRNNIVSGMIIAFVSTAAWLLPRAFDRNLSVVNRSIVAASVALLLVIPGIFALRTILFRVRRGRWSFMPDAATLAAIRAQSAVQSETGKRFKTWLDLSMQTVGLAVGCFLFIIGWRQLGASGLNLCFSRVETIAGLVFVKHFGTALFNRYVLSRT